MLLDAFQSQNIRRLRSHYLVCCFGYLQTVHREHEPIVKQISILRIKLHISQKLKEIHIAIKLNSYVFLRSLASFPETGL